jgi:hypothetical protein
MDMTTPRMPIFDGHNDVLSRLYRRGGADGPLIFLRGEAEGHLDLPKALEHFPKWLNRSHLEPVSSRLLYAKCALQ